MNTKVEPNALLLQVLAHDLLSPLTAIKWQVELLGKSDLDSGKRAEYLENVADSTALGIALTKHAHVAASVLLGSYVSNSEPGSLSTVVRTVAHTLTLQYERHGLSLGIDVRDDDAFRSVDRELVSLFVWSVAKFFLTCTPARATVRIEGKTSGEDGTYMVTVYASDVPERQTYVEMFSSSEAKDQYDQTHVFTQLIHATAPLIGADVVARVDDATLRIETTFVREATH